MNNLEINADRVTEFKGLINGHIIDVETIYDTVKTILDKLTQNLTNTTFTKQDDFVGDLIDAFTTLYDNDIDNGNELFDSYTNAKNTLINTDNKFTSLDDLLDIIENLIEDYEYTEFDTLYKRLLSNYYTT